MGAHSGRSTRSLAINEGAVPENADTIFWAAVAKVAASDKDLAKVRRELASYTADTFSQAGRELHELGHIFGPDRASGASPQGHGSDEVVAVALLLRICAELVSSFALLFQSGRQYGAAALLRQIVEIEYLAWAFQTRDKDAERWLRSTREERQSFFAPAKLRQAAKGKFRGQDYGHHCELGGHPVPGSSILLSDNQQLAQLLVADLLGHTGRIWDHLVLWADDTAAAVPIHKRQSEMLARYVAWKQQDPLTGLPPPP
jgi:hypothetical protein